MLSSSQIAAVAMIPDFNSAIKGRSCIVKSGSFSQVSKAIFIFKKCNGLVNSILERKVLADSGENLFYPELRIKKNVVSPIRETRKSS
jgi:hypothetical protein